MSSFIPDIHPLEVQVDGLAHQGSWYKLFGQIVVNFQGHTLNLPADPAPAQEQLDSTLCDLVYEHYVGIEEIPAEWPTELRTAAHQYINSQEDESSLDDLVAAFGPLEQGSPAFSQLAWLCLNATSVVAPAWKELCDGNGPEETLAELKLWMENPSHPIDWDRVTEPTPAQRNGDPIEDSDACRAEPIAEAVAATASFLKTAEEDFAIQALSSASGAHEEGCHPDDDFETFEDRLVRALLPPALESRSTD